VIWYSVTNVSEENISSVFTYHLKTEAVRFFEIITNCNREFEVAYLTAMAVAPKAKNQMV